jgi:hypothetical protein
MSTSNNGSDFCTFEEAAGLLGISERRVALLLPRKVLVLSIREDGTRGVSRNSVEAERARRERRGAFGKVWDGVKAVLRWMP